MTKNELREIVKNIQTTKSSTSMTKRQFVNAFGFEKRTSGNNYTMDLFLDTYNIKTTPSYQSGNIDDMVELSFKYNIKSDGFQLYNLNVKGYKNLNIDVDFENTDRYCCFIGLNGSGKSNILEAISAIFYSLYHIAILTDGLRKYPCEFKYKISYILKGEYYEIQDGKLKNGGKITNDILPKNVIVSYSGEDTRLWKKYYKPIYEKFCNKVTATPSFTPPFLFNISKYQWELSLLVLLFSEDIDVVPFVESITKGCECEISFNYNLANLRKWEGTQTEALIEKLRENTTYTIGAFRNLINDISFIEQASTLFYCLYKCCSESDSQVISKINISFSGRGNVEGLSEGEKKMIIANTMIHILASKDSLCMFDEPDSHIHISRKTGLLQLIDTPDRYNILTSHSPIFINIMRNENIRHIVNGELEDSNKLKQITELSGNNISLFDGAFILSAPFTLIVEGTYDIKYIKKAISIFAQRDIKYSSLKQLAYIPMGSAGNTESFYNDVIVNMLPNAKKIIYLFDYDTAGLQGWKKIEELKHTQTKLENIFYQEDYSISCATDRIDTPFFVEDMFDIGVYQDIIDEIHSKHQYNEYKAIKEATCKKIKDKIEKKYNTFDDDSYLNFAPLLDKILDIITIQ